MSSAKRRKSLRKEIFETTVRAKEYIGHFTLDKEGNLRAKKINLKKNPNKISFGKIKIGKKVMEFFAYKDQPKLVFIAINGEFIPLDKFKLRETVALCSKAAWFIGLYGKRAKKYRSRSQY